MSKLCDNNEDKEKEIKAEFSEAIKELATDSLKMKACALYKNQRERDGMMEKGYNEEFYALENKYNLQYLEINKQLSDIINSGTAIPNFWKTTLENAKFFTINEKDKEVLKYLTNIEIKYDCEQNTKSFTTYFYFSENPFFEHKILTKSYIFNKADDCYSICQATEIQWKGEAPNVKTFKKKVKKGKNICTVTKEKKVDSFFNIFDKKEGEDNEEEEKEDEEDKDNELNTEADFIQNDLVPFSMEYYLDLQKLGAIDDNLPDIDEDEEN